LTRSRAELEAEEREAERQIALAKATRRRSPWIVVFEWGRPPPRPPEPPPQISLGQMVGKAFAGDAQPNVVAACRNSDT
jgi:hypothetical protein